MSNYAISIKSVEKKGVLEEITEIITAHNINQNINQINQIKLVVISS